MKYVLVDNGNYIAGLKNEIKILKTFLSKNKLHDSRDIKIIQDSIDLRKLWIATEFLNNSRVEI